MLIRDYAAAVKCTDALHADGRALAVRRYGLFGQVGGLLELVKKKSREAQLNQQHLETVEELGDITWYVCALAQQLDIDALELFRNGAAEIGAQYTDRCDSFEELDEACKNTRSDDSEDVLLHALAARAGSLLDVHPGECDQIAALTGFVAAQLSVSVHWSLSLAEAARKNVEKTMGRWPGPAPEYGYRLDIRAKQFEQFPQELEFDFVQREHAGRKFVYPQIAGLNIGDRLTDNRLEPDGYRFHDVFHIAYAVHLGWSPVLRALLKLKRKHDAKIDENEDGGRAIIIEEGVATWIFNHASQDGNDYYSGVKRGQLPYRILKQVREMTRGYEVYERPLWQWEVAILDGFHVFRQLLDGNGGSVSAEFDNHRLTYTPPKDQVQ